MEKSSELQVVNHHSSRGLSRREMVQRLFGGAGAGLAIPGLSGAHPIQKHLARGAMLEEAGVQAANQDWTPAFLDAHQDETLIVLAELIVPGSTKARVNRFIDLLLSVDTQDNQKEFVAALSALEAEALNLYSHPFRALTQEKQVKILTGASTAGEEEAHENPKQALKNHFENLKGWISGAYYSSEIGMRELGWTGSYYFESFPGCQHPEGHH
jgi:Gluconate 2-dehydrogenase subunit 3